MKLLACVGVLALLAGCGDHGSRAHGKRVIVLGVDGMDPVFVERHWDALPNLRRLRDVGGLKRLSTTTPPQSPVAWSTFSTGLDPDEHGLFDFVLREPGTGQLLSSMGEAVEARRLMMGPYALPLGKARVRSFRSGRAFWEVLADHGIPATVIRIPVNYPPVERERALAGMGTPDLEGTFGTFTYYTDDPFTTAGAVSGGRIVTLAESGHRVVLPIEGPPNPLRRDRRPTRVDLVADIDPDAPVMRCQVGGSKFILQQGEWSPWIRVRFDFASKLAGASGMFRLYARELHPAIRIYRSPLNADPEDPALSISFPPDYGRELAESAGEFYTQGIPEDTSALRQGALSLEEYLAQSKLVADDERRLLRKSLDLFRDGFLFFYFSEIDQNSHMLWGRHDTELLETYRGVDEAIGETLRRAADATVIVMSDHGFAAFDRSVNLNTWLWREGFLALSSESHIDWTKTKAYALGLNAVYLNLAGREKSGIVHPGIERDGLLRTLTARLESLRDPETGARVVLEVAPVHSSSRYSPDLIVGYAPGYRCSWETALGDAPPGVIRLNDDAWIGDHCIAASAVPGVLLSNRDPRPGPAGLKDLTVTILREFGIEPDARLTGRSIY